MFGGIHPTLSAPLQRLQIRSILRVFFGETVWKESIEIMRFNAILKAYPILFRRTVMADDVAKQTSISVVNVDGYFLRYAVSVKCNVTTLLAIQTYWDMAWRSLS